MSKWMVELKGERADFKYIQNMLCSSELGVIEENGKFYLRAAKFDTLSSLYDVRAQAKALLQYLNGAAKLESQSFQTVELGSAVKEGDKVHRVLELGVGWSRSWGSTIIVKHGEQVPSKSPEEENELTAVERYMVVAKECPEVAKVLGLLASEETTSWGTLYKVYEVVRSDVGGAMYKNEWIGESEERLFKRTANSPVAIGDEAARHGYQKEQPPPNPMSLTQARSLIANLVKRWILSKCS